MMGDQFPDAIGVSESGVIFERHDSVPLEFTGVVTTGYQLTYMDDIGNGTPGIALLPVMPDGAQWKVWVIMPLPLAGELGTAIALLIERATQGGERGEV